MAFPEDAESMRAKAHLGAVRTPVLVGVTACALVVVALVASTLLGAFSSGGFSIEKGGAGGAQAEAPAQESGEDASAARTVCVHVGGAVAAPGVQELPEGARVQDAIEAAGGFSEGAATDALNLARVVADGEQVIVPSVEEQADAAGAQQAASAAPGAAGSGVSAGGKININRASASELDALPGVGPSTAEKIVADREANGPFATIEDLKRVSGIGDKKYAALADAICVG